MSSTRACSTQSNRMTLFAAKFAAKLARPECKHTQGVTRRTLPQHSAPAAFPALATEHFLPAVPSSWSETKKINSEICQKWRDCSLFSIIVRLFGSERDRSCALHVACGLVAQYQYFIACRCIHNAVRPQICNSSTWSAYVDVSGPPHLALDYWCCTCNRRVIPGFLVLHCWQSTGSWLLILN